MGDSHVVKIADFQSIEIQNNHVIENTNSLPYFSRDLAARNCLVGDNHVVKISDFQISRFKIKLTKLQI